MSSEHRAFRGVWIPAEIWLSEDLTLQEKVMLVEIDSLQHPTRGCFKTNKKLAEFFQLSASRVSEIISSLAKKGYVRIDNIREGKQIVERRIFMANPFEKPDTPSESRRPPSEKADNPLRNHEGPPSENAEERGSGFRGSSLRGSEEVVASGAQEPATLPARVEPEVVRDEPRVAIPADMPGPKDPACKTFKAWANYAVTYRQRYTTWPIWNQRIAGQLSQLVDRVGKDLAPGVAAYFLRMNNQYYVTKGHPVGLMLQDCETIATQMQTGQQMTATRARQMDGTQANMSAADEAKALLNATWGE